MTHEEFAQAIEAALLETGAKNDEEKKPAKQARPKQSKAKKPKKSTASSSVISNAILAEADVVATTSPLEHGEG